MPVRNDWMCNDCGTITEFIGEPERCSGCGSANLHIVFKCAPQIIPRHASVIKHVLEYNQKRMNEVYEEDASSSSEYQRLLREGYRVHPD